MWSVDAVVIGAGAVGLACAAALARRGGEVIVLEQNGKIGAETSSRNSEVVHAGLYYPTGSLKHVLCVEGRRKLYRYLDSRRVAHQRCGKLIVATSEAEIAEIESLWRRGVENGVEDLQLITGAAAIAMEPALSCRAAIWSPQTGILDSHGYLLALQSELEDHAGSIALATPVEAVSQAAGGFVVHTGGADPTAIGARFVVNAAGLHATRLAQRIEGLAPEHVPTTTFAKGSYFGCSAKPAFTRLIYPAPVQGGLGVHVTLDLSGRMRFGPDVEWLDLDDPQQLDYTVDLRRADGFYAAVRRYWPGLPDGALTPDYAGCRPKLSGPGAPAADFRIDGPETHGVAGLVNLFGIESPGLTSSLAIADAVLRSLACGSTWTGSSGLPSSAP
jgi:L-2-hydroxyglutarate oxidase LhgO